MMLFIVTALVLCSFDTFVRGDDKFYAEMPKELRCSGCELTVKVLDQMLSRDTSNVELRVKNALDVVCDVERYSLSEYNSERMVKVCEFMKKKHGSELRRELIKYYSQSKKSTYLEFVQHVCLDVMRLCAGISHKSPHHEEHEEDSVLHFDSESHGFTVVPGRNIKMMKPVHELHDEL